MSPLEEKRSPETPGETMARFLNALMRSAKPETLEDLRESLQAMGVDPNEVISVVRAEIERAREAARLNWATQARDRLRKARALFGQVAPRVVGNRAEQLDLIRRALIGEYGKSVQTVAAAFHKIEELPPEDLASLVEDIECLRLLEGQRSDES